MKLERFMDWLWLIFWAFGSSIWCVSAAGQFGATYDEPAYVQLGLEHWRTGDCRSLMKVGTMPLPADVATLPLYCYERWQNIRLERDAHLEMCLPWARATTLLFWWMLLGYGWLAGRRLAGAWGGRLAVTLLACEPTLLAHSSLATTDIAASACLLGLVHNFRRRREEGRFLRVGLPALWFAAAVLSKASGLVFGPLCLVAVEVERMVRAGAFTDTPAEGLRGFLRAAIPPLRRSVGDIAGILFVGFILVVMYCGSSNGPARGKWIAQSEQIPAGSLRTAAVWLAEHAPLPNNALDGLVFQIQHNLKAGEGTYLLEEYRPPGQAMWYYFPIALTMKLSLTPLALLVLMVILRPRSLANWALVATAVLLLFSLTCRVQIGVRYMLPLVGLGGVGLAAAVVRTCQGLPHDWQRRALAGLVSAGVAWSAAGAVIVWPNGLCYTNEMWGGTAQGYLCLSDSNYDWGQGLKELARWHEHQSVPLDVCYFGTDPAIHKLPLRPITLQEMAVEGDDGMLSRVRGHFLAVSTTTLYGHPASGSECAVFLRKRQPVDRTSTFLIFDFREEKTKSF